MENYSIVSLKGMKFTNGKGVICEFTGDFGLFVEGRGLISFKDINKPKGVKIPYANTKNVLQDIISAGGLINFSNVEFLYPINIDMSTSD